MLEQMKAILVSCILDPAHSLLYNIIEYSGASALTTNIHWCIHSKEYSVQYLTDSYIYWFIIAPWYVTKYRVQIVINSPHLTVLDI